jgi:uncharacterized membrane protein
MRETTEKLGRRSGLILLVGGVVLAIAFGIWEALRDDSAPALVRVAVVGIVVGSVILLLNVWLQRLRESKNDPYKDVEI